MNPYWTALNRHAAPERLYRYADLARPWLTLGLALCLAPALYGALIASPADYQQGQSVRIMYVHVPSAWMSLMVYVSMAVAGAAALIWRTKQAEWALRAMAPIGATFCALTLISGSLWGRPTWGAYWAWDARLTSQLILMFLYFGVILLADAFSDARRGARAASVLALLGVINVPIIHYSVVWWNSLHQGDSISLTGGSSIDASMLWPLLCMTAASKFYFVLAFANRMQVEIARAEANHRWFRQQVLDQPGPA